MLTQYDGTNYHGWQRQANTPKTIQEISEDALCVRVGKFHTITAAGRTDAGVHALAMPCVFSCEELNIPFLRLPLALNSLLPSDIRIVGARQVSEAFDPIGAALSKTYRYSVDNSPIADVFSRKYAWHIPRSLDVSAMRQAAGHLVGTHDFKAFSAANGSAKTSVRTIFAINVAKSQQTVHITIRGNGFLYNMVRIISGTLVDVGLGRTPADSVLEILQSRQRKKAGQTAPAFGLMMLSVDYGQALDVPKI